MFKNLSECGFSAAELNIDREGASAHSLTMDTTEAELYDIKKEADSCGISIAGVSTSLYGGLMGSPVKEEREEAKAVLRKQLTAAAALGAECVLAVPGADIAGGADIAEAYQNAYQTLSEMKAEIEEAKIYVCLENVWNAFFTSAFDMKNFIDRLDSPYIKAYYDVGNTVAFSDTVSWINILGERIKRVHIKGYKRNIGVFGALNGGGDFVDLLDGDIDWRGVINALKKAGYESFLTAEVAPTKKYADMREYYKKVSEEEDKILSLEELS